MARRRHLSRIAVMQVLFEREKHEVKDLEAALGRNLEELGDCDAEFSAELLKGTAKKEEELKKAIQDNAPQWPIERMDPISRCILLVGAYEILYHKDAPVAVVMNEAIDIAKEYGTAEGGKFVNGVLNAIAHKK